jgi:glycine/D-amino acid oxidase-like deaminating enzyme
LAEAAPGRRRDARELTADTVVVGAGIAGCAVARSLAESGRSVVVVDRDGIGAGASGRNGGFLFRQPDAWVNELLEESVEIYEELQSEGPIEFDCRARPQLVLAVEDDELERARAYADAVGGREVDLREDPWFADDLAGGYVVEGGYTVDAMGATIAIAEAARRAGAVFRLGCEAKRILAARGRVTGLATDEGVFACEHVVDAAGPRARFLLRTAAADVPVSSSRGWLLETARVDPPPPYAIEQALWPAQDEMARMVVDPTIEEVAAADADEPGLVSLLLGARPAGHCLIGTSLRRSLLEESETPETVRRLAERAARVSPHLRDVPVVAAWSGRRAMTPDGLPVAGRVPGLDGVDVLSGLSSIGMVTGPALGRRLAHGADLTAYDPARFA